MGKRIFLGTNHYQIEVLTNLYEVPEGGTIVVVKLSKTKRRVRFPARVFAILPEFDCGGRAKGRCCFGHGVPDNRCLGGIGVIEPGHIHAVYAEHMGENVLTVS